jgi:hypothetical protein
MGRRASDVLIIVEAVVDANTVAASAVKQNSDKVFIATIALVLFVCLFIVEKALLRGGEYVKEVYKVVIVLELCRYNYDGCDLRDPLIF